jgi:hypothetical protein
MRGPRRHQSAFGGIHQSVEDGIHRLMVRPRRSALARDLRLRRTCERLARMGARPLA